ncbi:MAG: HD-GYP domain-containing protein [Clostridiaceae bacterium]|nr:HD-GYP domain-containing protein [Clostridiaceae bacterium]
MRYVPIEYAREGDFLAQPILSDTGLILLSKGARLTEGLIKKIKKQGFYSIYILDKVSDEEIEDIIKPQVRQQAASVIKKIVGNVPLVEESLSINKKKETQQSLGELGELMKLIVDDVFNQKDLVLNLVDIKSVDDYTYQHSVNVMLNAIVLGMGIGLNRNELYDLATGAAVHDVGKVFVPVDILKKPKLLTPEEFEVIQQHTSRGYNFLKDYSDFPAPVRIVSLQHQEKVDGTGYPMQLKGKDIHIYARITAISDVYDALTSDRHYRRALPGSEALEYIMGSSGRHFDAELVKTFVAKVNPYPVGTLVRLNNGMEGVVEKVNGEMHLRPIVKILNIQGKEAAPFLCDLLKEYTLVIEDIIYRLSEGR